MSSRALSSATVMFLIGCLAAASAQAQNQNLEAGKSPGQIFAGTCSECHKSSRGLLRSVPAASLAGFLRQHYTTSGEMASVLSAYLIANGAADRRGQPKPGTDAKSGDVKPTDQVDRRGRRLRPGEPPQEAAKPDAAPQQAARPNADGVSPQAERRGRRRLARPEEAPGTARPADGQAPAQATGERGPDGRKSAARLRRGRPGVEEPPKADAATTDTGATDTSKADTPEPDTSKADDEPSKGELVKQDKPATETAKGEDNRPAVNKPEGVKPPGEGRSEGAKIDAPNPTGSGETPALRADPVPPVTPAPAASAPPPAAASAVTPERASAPPAPAAPSEPPSVTASSPPPPPAAPTGPPVPPISQ